MASLDTDVFDNAITQAVARVEARLPMLTDDARRRLEASATLDHGEWLALGPLASESMVRGLIDADIAQALYAIHAAFNNGATLAQRVVFMQMSGELLKHKAR